MAGTKVYNVLPTEVMRQLSELEGHIEEITDAMLDAGVDAVKPEIEKNLRASITKGYATGGLVNSMAVKKQKGNRKGLSYKGRFITFEGVSTYQKYKSGRLKMRRVPVRNNEIAAVLEYGKSDQAAQSFLRTAFAAKEGAINAAIEQTFEEKTKKYRT